MLLPKVQRQETNMGDFLLHGTVLLPQCSASHLSENHHSKVLCLLIHTADISHPGKRWEVHSEWTSRITEEFFRQGDWEKELCLSPSPLCDRNTNLHSQSQLGKITAVNNETHITFLHRIIGHKVSKQMKNIDIVNWRCI